MKKSEILIKMGSAMAAVLLVAGVVMHFLWPSDREAADTVQMKNVEENTQQDNSMEDEETPEAGGEALGEEFTQADVRKLEMKLEMLESKETDIFGALEFYRSLPDALTEGELYRIAQSRVLQCYEENVALAAEAKMLLIGGLGVSIPSYRNQEDAMEAYGEYLKEQLGIGGLDSVDELGGYLAGEIIEGAIGQIGSESVQNAVRYGIDGALEAYEADGTLGDVLSGAMDSVVEGVVSDIQEYPYELARNALDEVTGGLFSVAEGLASSDSPEDFLANLADEKSGGLFSSVASVITYESSPTALFQSMSGTASASAVKLSAFLEKDTINSGDIANMMYQYSQYGELLHDLNGYNWGENYGAMQKVYTEFVQNEVMIDFLSGIVNGYSGEQPDGTKSAGNAEQTQEEDVVQSSETETMKGSMTERYHELETRIAELEERIPAYQEELEGLMESKFYLLYKYEGQLEDIKQKYKTLMNFNVKNFEAQYDVGGAKIIEDNKKINNAIGELSKYTPWGITLGLFSSMAMEDGNADYSAMVAANSAFGTGMQTITVDTKAEIEKFNAQITFYESLTKGVYDGKILELVSNEWLQEACENQYLLEYVLNGEDINLDFYADEIRKKLYIMGMEVNLIKDYYSTLLTASNSKSSSISSLNSQYQEIMAAVDPDGTGRIAGMVAREELGKYVIPLIDAGRHAEDRMSAVGPTSPLVDSSYCYSEYGKVYWYTKTGMMKWEGAGLSVYYASGEPVYIGSGSDRAFYVYKGILLNGRDGADSEGLCTAAKNLTSGGISLSSSSLNNISIIKNALTEYIE